MTASSASPQEQFPQVRQSPVAPDGMAPFSVARVIDFTHFQETGERVEAVGQVSQNGRRHIGLISSNHIDFGPVGPNEATYTPTRTERVVGAACYLGGALKEALALYPEPDTRPKARPEANARKLANVNRRMRGTKHL